MKASGQRSGIDITAMDSSIRPQDDLFGFVNGTWIAGTEIPADKGRYGEFDILAEKAREDVRALLEEAEAATSDAASGDVADGDAVARMRAQVGALYRSFLDLLDYGAASIYTREDAVARLKKLVPEKKAISAAMERAGEELEGVLG